MELRGKKKKEEKDIMEKVKEEIKEEEMKKELKMKVYEKKKENREKMRKEMKIFQKEGWKIKGKKIVDEKGNKLKIEFIGKEKKEESIYNNLEERMRKIGINEKVSIVEEEK